MKILKQIIRYFGYFIFLIVVVILWWIAATIRGDDPLDPGMDEFYHLDISGYEKDNGAVAMYGIVAPESEKDSYPRALKLTKKEIPKPINYAPLKKSWRQTAKAWHDVVYQPPPADNTPYTFFKGKISIH